MLLDLDLEICDALGKFTYELYWFKLHSLIVTNKVATYTHFELY